MGFNKLVRNIGPRAPLPVAIDFGVGALKVLQVSGGDQVSLVGAGMLETPEELMFDHGRRLDYQMEALPKLIRGAGVKGRRAVCAIPCGNTFCKHVQIQRTDGVDMSVLVQAALATQLNCDPNALVYRFTEVNDVERPMSGSKAEVICIAANRALIQKLMQSLKTAKLEPVGMQSEFHATLNAFQWIHGQTEGRDQTTLYLDIGAGSTKVMIAHGPSLAFARMIELGGRHFDETIARQVKCSLASARRKRYALESAESDGGTAVATVDISEPLEIVCDEISMCIRYHASLFPSRKIERAVFLGGESRQTSLCQSIARRLRLPAQIADPMAGVARSGDETCVGVDMQQQQPGWAVALGLCMSPTDL
ncbi:MAG: pilus assembly protein PilM [Phycisphaerales bacterium]|nr:pilus assembly protein PilM [Phycisphaerales bacterium]